MPQTFLSETNLRVHYSLNTADYCLGVMRTYSYTVGPVVGISYSLFKISLKFGRGHIRLSLVFCIDYSY